MPTLISDTRRAIVAALSTINAGAGFNLTLAGRVVPGFNSRLNNPRDLEADVKANGVLCVVGPTSNLELDSLRYGPMQVKAAFYFFKSKQAGWDGFDLDDFWDQIMTVLNVETSYGTIANPASIRPKTCRLTLRAYQTDDCDGVLVYDLVLTIPDP